MPPSASVNVVVTLSLTAVMVATSKVDVVTITIRVLLEIIATQEFAEDGTAVLGIPHRLKDLRIIQSLLFLQLYLVLPFCWALLELLLQL